ncbi:MAG TPA: chloride channel protein [Candidatus Hydrogenedentes bacterium]|nr:chloride channel protein [Candidatus Hydrogenedentota bacterium]
MHRAADGPYHAARQAARRQAASDPEQAVVDTFRFQWRRFVERLRASETAGPVVIAVTIGIGGGLASILFRRLIDLAHFLSYDVLGGQVSPLLGAAITVPVVALGGLLSGLITRLAPETQGHGVPEVMVAVVHRGGRIRPRVTALKTIGAAITIGTGGSAGREGPIVQIGAAFGSSIGQWLRLPDRRIVLSAACGAAAGIAATFNAPMGGVIFALEVILARFTALSFGLIVISAATATVVSRSLSLEGDSPAFAVVQEHAMRGLPDLFCFVALGVLCALVAQVYVRFLYLVEDASGKARLPEYVKPMIGGALVGVVAIWAPQIMGSGYETIETALHAGMTMQLLFLLCAAKIACTAFTVGSGGSGGIFAPALFTGAMFGGGYGVLLNTWFPDHVSAPGAFALVGMAAVFGGAAHAPITSIFILFEMTDDYRIIVPLMSATVISTLISQRLSPESIYTLKLRRRGIDIGHGGEVNLMDAVTVAEAMDECVEGVPPNLPLEELMKKLSSRHERGYPVIDVDGRLVGIITMRDIEEALLSGRNTGDLTVADVCTRNVIVCRPDQTLNEALSQFGAHSVGRLPVIDPERPDRIIGVLDRAHIVSAYAEAYRRQKELVPRADAIQSLNEESEMVLEQAHVTAGSRLANVYVRDAGFPPESTLGAIRRARQTVVPHGSTCIQPGDQLIVLTTRENARNVRQWLEQMT